MGRGGSGVLERVPASGVRDGAVPRERLGARDGAGTVRRVHDHVLYDAYRGGWGDVRGGSAVVAGGAARGVCASAGDGFRAHVSESVRSGYRGSGPAVAVGSCIDEEPCPHKGEHERFLSVDSGNRCGFGVFVRCRRCVQVRVGMGRSGRAAASGNTGRCSWRVRGGVSAQRVVLAFLRQSHSVGSGGSCGRDSGGSELRRRAASVA